MYCGEADCDLSLQVSFSIFHNPIRYDFEAWPNSRYHSLAEPKHKYSLVNAISFTFAGPTDLPFFDLLSIFGKLRAGFGAMGLRPAAPVSRYLCFYFEVAILSNEEVLIELMV